MNIQEFNALKIGDEVSNAQGHVATVCTVGDFGVQVQWAGKGPAFTLYRTGRIWVTMDAVVKPECKDEGCPHFGTAHEHT